jgi:riboflavin kinase/FMN adenylyltransferase
VYDGSLSYPSPTPGPVVTIGNFDGVHLGHRALLARVQERARTLGAPVCAYTFEPMPVEVLRPLQRMPRIQSLEERIATLGDAGVDQIVVERFDREFSNREARWFAEEVLGRRLGCRAVVVGWDFRFGSGRSGSVEALREWLGVPVEAFGPWTLGDEVVSSSRIRGMVARGEVEAAARLLGRPHRVTGTVIRGDGRGRQLGFRTANLAVSTELLPAPGVYAVWVSLADESVHPGVMNHGVRPTFGAGLSTEVHLLDGDRDLYGQSLGVSLNARLRGEQRFSSVDALKTQIRDDIAAARRQLGEGTS